MTTTTLNTHELTGAALNWSMCMAEGFPASELTYWSNTQAVVRHIGGGRAQRLDFDTNANQMHEIIEREGIATWRSGKEWRAAHPENSDNGYYDSDLGILDVSMEDGVPGPTSLIAAARCWVAHKLGPVVEVPCELVEG